MNREPRREPRLPFLARLLFQFHVLCYRATRGVVGHRFGRKRFLLLTTIGARTSRRRTVALLYGRDGNALILIASKGGLPRNPSWYVNLTVTPRCEVQVAGRHSMVRARTATAGERSRLWAIMVTHFGGYEEYQRKTSREIPVVILRPVAQCR